MNNCNSKGRPLFWLSSVVAICSCRRAPPTIGARGSTRNEPREVARWLRFPLRRRRSDTFHTSTARRRHHFHHLHHRRKAQESASLLTSVTLSTTAAPPTRLSARPGPGLPYDATAGSAAAFAAAGPTLPVRVHSRLCARHEGVTRSGIRLGSPRSPVPSSLRHTYTFVRFPTIRIHHHTRNSSPNRLPERPKQ